MSEIDSHSREICSYEKDSPYFKDVNKEMTPDFTYRDLQDLIFDISRKKACKVNIGFGFILHHLITNEYRYYYPSSNHLLFDRMVTISSQNDVRKLMKRIIDLDLTENYYMKRPSSGWVVAGLPHVLIKVVYLNTILS